MAAFAERFVLTGQDSISTEGFPLTESATKALSLLTLGLTPVAWKVEAHFSLQAKVAEVVQCLLG